MNKFNALIFAPALTLALVSCSQVLQTVNLEVGNTDPAAQEEFQVTEKTLTLENAKIANQDPYPRNVIRPGRGSSARPILESTALQSNFPSTDTQSHYKIGAGDEIAYAIFEEDRRRITDFAVEIPDSNYSAEYSIGVGDQISYAILTEISAGKDFKASFPPLSTRPNYILGTGDELTLLRVKEASNSSPNTLSLEREGAVFSLPDASPQSGVIATSGRIGSDGSVLLLEVGRLEAAGKTLTEIQTEVRNILIRDGLSPRFQLELSGFASQRAILTVNLPVVLGSQLENNNARVITLTDRVTTLRDILAAAGLGIKTERKLLITLNRGPKIYKMTMRDIFNASSPSVIIKDGDTISVDALTPISDVGTSLVMSDGTVVLPKIGRVTAKGLTISELTNRVTQKVTRLPELQITIDLDVVKFGSQKAILTSNSSNLGTLQENNSPNSRIVTLTSSIRTLRTVLANAGLGVITGKSSLITLQRGSKQYRMTMRDAFNAETPDVIIEDGDTIYVDEFQSKIASGTASVMSDGTLVIPEVGRIKVIGSTINQVRRRLSQKIKTTPDITKTVDLDVIGFASQNATIHLSTGITTEGGDYSSQIIPIGTIDLPLSIALTKAGVKVDTGAVTQVTVIRDDETYRFSFEDLILKKGKQIFMLPNDQIFVDRLPYKENKVFALGGVEPKIINITPERRQTLADALFAENGVLASDAAKRSDVYLLRGTSPVRAYRLDAQSPTRLIVADTMELRPNDILYVAEQPIVSFNRALERIIPLRTLIADIAGSTE